MPDAGSASPIPGQPAPSPPAPGDAGTGDAKGGPNTARINSLLSQLPPPAPDADLPVGPGDLIEISVFEVEELSKIKVRIPMKGSITLPLLGQIPAAGRTALELQDEIGQRLTAKYMHNPQVSVFVHEHHSQRISVSGAVRKGGVITITSRLRLAEALASAEGLAEDADHTIFLMRRVPLGTVVRAQVGVEPPKTSVPPLPGATEEIMVAINLDELAAGREELNVPLQSGDIVFVPRAGSYYVGGEVVKPGPFFLKAQDHDPAGRHRRRRPEGRRRLGGHPALPREAHRRARGPDLQSQRDREGAGAARGPEARRHRGREVPGQGLLVRRLRLLQGHPRRQQAHMSEPAGPPAGRELPPGGTSGPLATQPPGNGALATAAPPVWAQPLPSDEAHFWDYWRVLVRHRWTVITFFLLALIVATVWTFTTRPVFTASATLRIDKEAPRVLKFDQVVPGEQDDYQKTEYQTQLKVLQSRALASRVIGLLSLDQHPEFQQLDAEDGWLARAQGWMREQLVRWIPVPPPPAPQASEDLALESPLTRGFAGRLAVEPVRNARLVRVSFESLYPDLAARVPNTLAEAFIAQSLEQKIEATRGATQFLAKQMEEAREKLEAAETRHNDFLKANDILFVTGDKVGERQDLITQQLTLLSDSLLKVRAERIQKESLVHEALSRDVDSLPAVLGNPFIVKLKEELVTLEGEYRKLGQTFKPEYPRMQRLEQNIAEVRGQLRGEIVRVVGTIDADYRAALRNEREIQTAMDEQRALSRKLGDQMVQYSLLRRDVDTSRELYTALLTRLKETQISSALLTSNIAIVDRAEVPLLAVEAPPGADPPHRHGDRALRRDRPRVLLRVPRHEPQGRPGGRGGPRRPDDRAGPRPGLDRRPARAPPPPAGRGERGRRRAVRPGGPRGDGVGPERGVPEPQDEHPLLVARPPAEDAHGHLAPARGRQDVDGDQPRHRARPAGIRRGAPDRRRHAAPEPPRAPRGAAGAGALDLPHGPGRAARRPEAHEDPEPLRDPGGPDPPQPGRADGLGAARPGAPAPPRAVRPRRLRRPAPHRRQRRHDPGAPAGGRDPGAPPRPREPRRRPAGGPPPRLGPRAGPGRRAQRRRHEQGGLGVLRLLRLLWLRRGERGPRRHGR